MINLLLQHHPAKSTSPWSESGILSSKVIQTLSPKELLHMMPKMYGANVPADLNIDAEDEIVALYQKLSTDAYNEYRKSQVQAGGNYEYVMVPQAYAGDDASFQNQLIQCTIDFFEASKESGGEISLFVLAASESDYTPVIETSKVLLKHNVPFTVKQWTGTVEELPDFALLDSTVFKVERYHDLPLVVEGEASEDKEEFFDVLQSSDFEDIDPRDLV